MTFVDPTRGHTEWYRRGHNEHDWKSCDGQKPSEGSNPSHSAKTPNVLRSGFSFFYLRVSCSTDVLDPLGRSNGATAVSAFLFAPKTAFDGESLLYIFVCKTHKNGENTQKFGYHAWIDLKEVEMFGQNDGAKGLQNG